MDRRSSWWPLPVPARRARRDGGVARAHPGALARRAARSPPSRSAPTAITSASPRRRYRSRRHRRCDRGPTPPHSLQPTRKRSRRARTRRTMRGTPCCRATGIRSSNRRRHDLRLGAPRVATTSWIAGIYSAYVALPTSGRFAIGGFALRYAGLRRPYVDAALSQNWTSLGEVSDAQGNDRRAECSSARGTHRSAHLSSSRTSAPARA